ncbi:hypothetical protein ACQ4M3_28310 [Leptolyngbya sp. AN03gr2]|uniref:hypothetical protein n=1 Tax=unclassified Leptolyngbya TaxID=2650499 RepID=UPI003D30F04E
MMISVLVWLNRVACSMLPVHKIDRHNSELSRTITEDLSLDNIYSRSFTDIDGMVELKRLLVTSGTGRIGTNFVQSCCGKYSDTRVIVLDAKNRFMLSESF